MTAPAPPPPSGAGAPRWMRPRGPWLQAGRGLLRCRMVWEPWDLWPRAAHSWLRLARSAPDPLGLGGQCFSCQRFPSPWASVAQPSSSKRRRRRGENRSEVGARRGWRGDGGGEDGFHPHPTSPSQRAAAGPGTEAQGLHPSSTLCVVNGPCGGRGRRGLLQGSRLGGWDPRRLGSEATG